MNTEGYAITTKRRVQYLTMFSGGAIKALKAQNLSYGIETIPQAALSSPSALPNFTLWN